MKQQVSPVVLVVAIIVVIAVLAAITYFAVLKPRSSGGEGMTEEAKQKQEKTRMEGTRKLQRPSGGGSGMGGPRGR